VDIELHSQSTIAVGNVHDFVVLFRAPDKMSQLNQMVIKTYIIFVYTYDLL